MTFDPNQKRGGPANAGNWAKYENSLPEGALPPAPTRKLTVVYNDGQVETIPVAASGMLPVPHRSDFRSLTELLGFKVNPFSPEMDLTLELALQHPEATVGLHPVFFTTEDAPTTVLGKVVGFEE